MASSSKVKIVRGHCPRCGPQRRAEVKGEVVTNYGTEEEGVTSVESHRLLQCLGCNAPYFQVLVEFLDMPSDEADTEQYWPAPNKRAKPEWLYEIIRIDYAFYKLLLSLYSALDNDITVLAASGVRTVFDRATELLGIDPDLPFVDKVRALKMQGRIGSHEEEDLKTMVDAGSAAMHRAWAPPPKELDTMMVTLERFLHHAFVLREKTASLKLKVPERRKGKKAERD